jgi:C1A family cysteine protease
VLTKQSIPPKMHLSVAAVVFTGLLFAREGFAQAEKPSPAPAAATEPETTIAEGFGTLIRRAEEARDQARKAGAGALEEAGKISRNAEALTREAAETARSLAGKASLLIEQPAAATPTPAEKEAAPDKSRKWSLRPEYEKLGLDIRDQGRRGSCTIFATLGVIEFHYARRGTKVELSEQYAAWAAGKVNGSRKKDGYSDREIIAGIKKFGICREDLMPYNDRMVGNPSKEAKADADTRRSISVTWFQSYGESVKNRGFTDQTIKAICGALADGDPVTVALKWPSFVKLDSSATMGTKNNPSPGEGHMVVLVGYDIDAAQPGGGRCQIRNSWGEDWGENGYAWLTFDYLKKNGDEAYAVKAF